MWCVCLYLEDRHYGGPEEGGWWYNAGDPLPEGTGESNEHVEDDSCQFFLNRKDALDFYRRMNLHCSLINQGRPSTGSMRSQGQYVVKLGVGTPQSYPKERPHYE